MLIERYSINRYLRVLLVPLMLTSSTHCLQAQSGALRASRQITIRDGLADHRVKYLFQDNAGLIWLNTANGFQRFDGIRFQTLRYEPGRNAMPSGIMNYGIVQDSIGNVWSVTEHEGPVCYNPSQEKLETLDISLLTASQLRTHDIVYSNNKKVYASSVGGLLVIKGNRAAPVETDSVLEQLPALRNQRDVCVEEDGTLLIASSGGFLRFDPVREKWQHVNNNPDQDPLINESRNISAVCKDRQSQVWYSTWESGRAGRQLYKYNPHTRLIDSLTLPPIPPQGNDFFNLPEIIVEDHQGGMWVATQGGQVYHYSNQLKLLQIVDRIENGGREFPFESVTCLFIDTSGDLWIACRQGLFIVSSASPAIRTSTGLPTPEFDWQYSLGRLRSGPNGHAIVQLLGTALIHWDHEKNELNKIPQRLMPGKWAEYQTWLAQRGPKHYFTPWFTDAVIEYDIEEKKYRRLLPPGQLGHLHTKAIPVPTGLLVYGRNRIILLDHQGQTLSKLDIEGATGISDWCVDQFGNVWMIDQASVLFKITCATTLKITAVANIGLRGEFYKMISYQDQLIVGSLYQGIVVIDSTGALLHSWTTEQGLLSNTIDRLYVDHQDRLWIETPVGFNYTRSAHASELFSSAELDKRYHEFLYACPDGNTGFYFLYKDRIDHLKNLSLTPPTAAPFRLLSVRSSTGKQLRDIEPALKWNDNQLAAEFAVLDYVRSTSLQYRYRIGGDWIFLGNISQLLLPRLQPGSYRLQLQYRYPNGPWMNNEIVYRFSVEAPFWQQAWFYIFSTILALAPFVIYFWRKYREQQKIAKIRWQLARDLHDDVGSTLSSIVVYSSVLQNRIKNESDVAILNEIREKAGAITQEMADIVWAIQPDNESLLNFLQRFREFAVPLLESRNIRIEWEGSIDTGVQLSMIQRRNLYLVCKEALNNCIKHADAHKFRFSYFVKRGSMEINLQDDGKGFDAESLERTNGLMNMQSRMQEIGGTFQINTSPGMGTRIKLQMALK